GNADEASSRAHAATDRVAAGGGAGLLQLPRHPWQHAGAGGVSTGGSASLAAGVTTPESAAQPDVGAFRPTHRSLYPQAQDPASTSERSLLRQAPEVRAVCGSSARTDLRGGPPARAVPTATALRAPRRQSSRLGRAPLAAGSRGGMGRARV